MDRSGVWRSFLLALALGAQACVLLVSPAWAATIQVTTTGDENGSNPAACSLREAVQSANINLPVGGCAAGEAFATDRISFASSTNGSAFLLSAGTLSVTSDVEIVGNGPAQTTIDCGVPTLSIDDVTVVEGNSGTITLAFTVTLSQGSEESVTVQYQTADGSASTVGDFVGVGTIVDDDGPPPVPR